MLHVFIINSIIILVVVLVHYEALRLLSAYLPASKLPYRSRVGIGLFGAMLAHIAEVWIFAISYYVMIHFAGMGAIKGDLPATLLNCAYFSFSTYTSLGYGDVVPFGQIRFLAGLEALTGLLLIAWTASFLYYEMQRYWSNQ